MNKSKEEVRRHLSNNFNVPECLDVVDGLITASNIYLKKPNIKYTIIVSVTNYVKYIFNCLGLVYETESENSGSTSDTALQEKILAPILDVFTEFRDKVRLASKNKDFG